MRCLPAGEPRMISVFALCVALLILSPVSRQMGDFHRHWAPLLAQNQPSAEDTRLLKRAKQAIKEYKKVRQSKTTFALGYQWARCFRREGRPCFKYDGKWRWEAPPEKPIVSAARDTLLNILRDAAAHAETNDWFVGQLVFHLVETEEGEAAV